MNAIYVKSSTRYGKVVSIPFSSGIKIGNKMTKYLQYSDYSEDKITIEEKQLNGNPFISKIWLNDVLVSSFYEAHGSLEPIIILK